MKAPAQEEHARELLAANGVRVTRPRLAVLAELAREEGDLTAQQLWRQLREKGSQVGIATVYRTLAALTEKGVVDALSHHPHEACYRLCGTEHHHHLVCASCHRVVELTGCGVSEWLDGISAEHGFVTTDHRVEVTGICPSCQD
jgi:Fur family transcriptional regulator, ferric uptake regulator